MHKEICVWNKEKIPEYAETIIIKQKFDENGSPLRPKRENSEGKGSKIKKLRRFY